MRGPIHGRIHGRALLVLAVAVVSVGATCGTAGAEEHGGGTLLTPGVVFTETNGSPNAVLAYTRTAEGKLTAAGSFATGGDGQQVNPPTGFPVVDAAGPVELSADGANRSCLFVVNTGSNTVSSFVVRPHGLTLAAVESSGGSRPVSVTSTTRGPGLPAHREPFSASTRSRSGHARRRAQVMYVLNSNIGAANIQGFYVSSACTLAAIPGSNQPTSSPDGLPASIRFDSDGRALAVSERFAPVFPAGTGDIDIFPVDSNGVAGAPVVTPSAHPTPYGLDWDQHRDILSVTNENIPGLNIPGAVGSSVTTYRLNDNDTLTPIDTKAAPGAACWNLFTKDGRFLYTSQPAGNAFVTGTEDAFQVDRGGTMTPIADYTTTYQAIDNALSHNSRFLYVLSAQIAPPAPPNSAIDEYAIDPADGTLTPIGTVLIPGSSHTSGLAAW